MEDRRGTLQWKIFIESEVEKKKTCIIIKLDVQKEGITAKLEHGGAYVTT